MRKRVTRVPLHARVPERLLGALRVGAYVLTMGAGLILLVGYRARAQLTERLIDTGMAMLAYEGAHRQDGRRTLLFNGQPIHFSSGMTRHGLQTVLDFYEAHCLSHDGGVLEDIDAFVEARPEVRLNRSMLDPILRHERGHRGTVACLYTEERGGVASFLERYERYAKSGDVAEIGDMRYLYAQEGANGTHFVVFWTEGRFVLRDLLPKTGDAPGDDPRDLGRPSSVRRLASLREVGSHAGMTVYVAREAGPDVAALEAHYRRDLARREFRLFEPVQVGRTTATVISAEKGGRIVTLVLDTRDDGRAAVTVLEGR